MAIQNICNSMFRSDGMSFVYDKTNDEVQHLIWLSQIKTIYPYIEKYREEFVRKYATAIQKQLPITSSYGERYESPKDVELGTLKYMVDNGHIVLSCKEYDRLKNFKEARNKLSHLSCLSLTEIKAIV